MKHTFLILLACCYTALAQPATTVNTLADLQRRKPLTNSIETVYVRSAATNQPFTKPLPYRYEQTSALSTNRFCLETGTGIGRWVHDWDGNVLDFGLSKTASAAVNGAAFRAALLYSDSLTNGRVEIKIPPGTYMVDHMGTNVATNVRGENWTDISLADSMTIIIQEPGNTNDLMVLSSTNWVKPTIENLQLYVAGETGRRNPKAITGVTDRLTFTVATGDIPAAPPSPSTWPYYGYCFFYTSEGRYMGSGIVQTVNSGTGEIGLMAGSDKYATRTAASGLLSTAENVVWSPVVTESPVFSGTPITATGPDPTRAAPVGIRVFSKGYCHIKNVRIMYGHCGIAIGVANTGLQLDNANLEWSRFAGYANIFPALNSDSWCGRVRIGGQYYPDSVANPESSFDRQPDTIELTDANLRNTHVGVYMPSYSSSFDDLLVFTTVHGLIGSLTFHVLGGVWIFDNMILDGLIWRDASTGSNGGGMTFQVSQLTIRPIFLSAPKPIYYTNETAAIKFNGDNKLVKGRIGQLTVDTIASPAGTNRFTYLYDADPVLAQGLAVKQFGSLTGIENLYSPVKQRIYSDSWIIRGSNTVASLNHQRLEVQQTNGGGYSHSIKEVYETSTGSGASRFDAYLLNDLTRYTHYVDGSIDNRGPDTGASRFHRWHTDATNKAEVYLGFGTAVDSTFNIRGDQIFTRTTSSTNTAKSTMAIQGPGIGGNLNIGDGSSVVNVNGSPVVTKTWTESSPVLTTASTNGSSGFVINSTGSNTEVFRVQGDGTNLWRVIGSDWSTSGKTPHHIRYNGALPQIGVTNINGAAVLYLIGTTPP
jgi:hypothetical protein